MKHISGNNLGGNDNEGKDNKSRCQIGTIDPQFTIYGRPESPWRYTYVPASSRSSCSMVRLQSSCNISKMASHSRS